MNYVLAIDQGTSGTKALVVGPNGHVHAEAEEQLRPNYRQDGGVEIAPRELLRSVVSAGRRALATSDVPVAAVALANQGETVLAWDPESGHPQGPALVWQDRRAEDVCRELAPHRDRLHERTGLQLDPYFSAPKMAWLRRRSGAAGVVTTSDTWLVNQLCGAFVTDVSTASRSLILDIHDATWSDELAALFGMEDEKLPELVHSDDIVGTTDVFGPSLPVTGLIVDQQAALLAQACLTAGTAKCTFGTGAFVLAQTGAEPVISSSGLTSSVAWGLRGQRSHCVDGQVYTAASAVRWLIDLGLLNAPNELDVVAADDANGVLCVPALAGLAAPWWSPSSTARLEGLRLGSGRGQVVKAVLDGIAAQVAVVMRLMGDELTVDISRLRVDGGLARSATLMQAQADLLQAPVEVFPSPHATGLGAAACAQLALDPSLSPDEAVGGWAPVATYEPRWSPDQSLEFMARWERAAGAAVDDAKEVMLS